MQHNIITLASYFYSIEVKSCVCPYFSIIKLQDIILLVLYFVLKLYNRTILAVLARVLYWITIVKWIFDVINLYFE
jgi:hypothetical protein